MPSAHLLEREEELDEVRSAWERAGAGEGRLVVVEGAAGSGKSALLAVATAGARADGLRVLAARGGELERGLAFGTVRRLFETIVSTAAATEREELLAGAAAPAAWVVAPGGDRGAAGAGAEAEFAALHGIYWLASNLSHATPLLLAVDDLHWVDGSSVRALSYLVRRIADLPIALVVALRPDEPGTPVELLDKLRAEPEAALITLRPLRLESVSAIVAASVPGADQALCSACFAASGGNPFYLRELLRTITGAARDEDAATVVRETSVRAVGDRVVRRISRVGPDAVALARAMAVLSDGRLADAAALAGLDEATAASAASHMRRIEILAREDPFLDVAVKNAMPQITASGAMWLQDAMVERPSLDDYATLVESIELEPAFLATTTGAMLLECRGRLRLARGDREGAVADLRACAATNAALGFGPTYSSWRSTLALALPGDAREEAPALAEEELTLAAATGLARPHGIALRAAGLLRGDADGLACLRASVAVLQDSPARLEHARSLVELGAALRRRGQRAQAREALAAGMELAHRCGAERLVARADEELRAAGAHPRRIVRTGVDALTPSEMRAVRLAAEGHSNAQVAQELFVSLKTVETHLTHAYAKLDLTGPGARRQLAAALEQPQP